MISNLDLVTKFQYALSHKWGYIPKKSGQFWTEADQKAATNETVVKWGKKWVGHNVADCSGLFVWAFKQLGGSIYHGSNTIFRKYCSKTGPISGDIPIGSAVFKRRANSSYEGGYDYYHIGLYVGGGAVIEAKGTYYGVVKSALSEWSYYGVLKGVDYGPTEKPVVPVAPAKEEDSMSGKAIVDTPNDKTVRLRKSPSTSGYVLTHLPEGTPVNITEDDGTWCKVRVEVEGYIMSKFLKES